MLPLLLPLLACLASTHGDPHASAAYGRFVPSTAPDHVYPAGDDLMLVWHTDEGKVVWRRYPPKKLAGFHHVHEDEGAWAAVRFHDGSEKLLFARQSSDLKTEVGLLARHFELPVEVEGSPPEPEPKPKPTSDDPIILGALDKTLIDQTIKADMASFRACYQAGLNGDFSLGGWVVVKFVIEPDGTVGSTSIKGTTMGEDEVEQCLLDAYAELVFPEPKGGGIVIVSYPFVFSPS